MNNNILHSIQHNRVLLHTLFWLSTLVVYPIYALGFEEPVIVAFLEKLFDLPAQILATYFLLYYLIPKYIYTKKYVLFFLLFILSAIFFCRLAHLIDDYIAAQYLTPYHDIHSIQEILTHPFSNVWDKAWDVYLTVLLVAIIKFVKDRFKEKEQLAQLQKEKASAELNLLKAQINPRILTKSLRQLQYLATQQSDSAPEMVLKLADILDYMLYQCNDATVRLKKELLLLKNYLEIEQLRYGADLSTDYQQHISTQTAEIAPLLLLTIVELAFQKEPHPNKKEQVRIRVHENENQLTLEVTSTLMEVPDTETINRQLNLLYKDKYTLTIKENKLHLTLDLCPTLLPV